MREELRRAIIATSQSIGVNPLDLATAMSYETAGTLDPWKRGPTTKWGTHRGLIQWGEPQARQYGVSKDTPVADQVAAAGKYLQDRGVQPGHGLLEIYSAINAGGVGDKFYGRSDAHAGGAPGTVRDKVTKQMEGHRRNAERLLGEVGSLGPSPSSPAGGARAASEIQPPSTVPGSFAPSAPSGSPFSIDPAAASLAANQEQTTPGDRLAASFASIGQQVGQMRAPSGGGHPGGPSPQQANALLAFMNNPTVTDLLLKRRLPGALA